MKSAILISTLWMLATSASVVPIDESSSTVNVKQGSNEYSYHIQQSHGVAAQSYHPVDLLKSGPNILDSPQAKSSEGVSEKTHPSEELEAQAKNEAPGQSQGRSNDMQPFKQLKIALPSYLPASSVGLIKEGMDKQQLQEQLKIALPSYLPAASVGLIKEEMDKQQLQEQLKITLPGYQLLPAAGVGLIKEGMEKQQQLLQEQLKLALPGYRLLPANANIQYTDLTYYHPYLHGYGLQYPYNLPMVLRYI